jgi:hypothetical protein
MGDLDKLIAAVEAGTLCSGEFCVSAEDVATIEAVFPMTDDDDTPELIGMAMDGSLDAALRLHEALLPGYPFPNATTTTEVVIFGVSRPGEGGATGWSKVPSRAWLLAVLRALAQTPTDPGDGWTWHERLGWIGPDGKPAARGGA